ncbi:MAG: DNA polymerase III subunit delta [Deltaproteobacteria bacterium]|jgi:DNA polymerase-3 subunit delta|nr:DNA polymerase III subunit delta [Deltaproteobacteria bacterium]
MRHTSSHTPRNPARPGFSLCISQDSTLLKDYMAEQLAAWPPAPGLSWERWVFWAERKKDLDNDFWSKLTMQSLFRRPRAILLRQAQLLEAGILKEISSALGRANPEVWLFLCLETEFERGKPKLAAHITRLQCYVFARKKGWIREIPPLDARAKKLFIQKEASGLGLRLKAEELNQLLLALPQDAGAMRLELAKLSLASDSAGALAPEALRLLEAEPDMDIFAFLKGLQSGRSPERVWARFHKNMLRKENNSLFAFLGLLLREGRALWQILAGEATPGLPDYVRADKESLARSLDFGGLARIWDLALRAHKGVLSGEYDEQQAFELLLADLFQLFRV